LNESNEYVDLHNNSLPIARYKEIFKPFQNKISMTETRAEWFGGLPRKFIRPRKHDIEPILSYWTDVLQLEMHFPKPSLLPIVEDFSYHHSISVPCRIIFSFQSSADHKVISSEIQKELLLYFSEEHCDMQVIVGPGSHMYQEVIKLGKKVGVTIVDVNSPKEIVQLFSKTCLLISIDNGINHLAGAFAIPRITIYGPTSPRICGSGLYEMPVLSSSPCSPCGCVESCPKYDYPICLNKNELVDKVVLRWKESQVIHYQM
jgi:hypothetical protein